MPSAETELYLVLEPTDLATSTSLCSKKIVDGFEPLRALTLRQVGNNVTYLQAFWRPNAVATFIQ